MLTWETNHPPELKGNWEYDPKQGAVKLILDGQQRVTTLYMLIRGQIPHYYSKAEITHDTRGLYVNLATLELQYYQKTMMANDPRWVNITDIFQKKFRCRDIIRKLKANGTQLTDKEEDTLDDNYSDVERIPDLEFLEQPIPVHAALKEAINIFYIVNASGVNLTEAELALAQISGYWPKARELFKIKLSQLKKDGFIFKLDFIIYCLLGILHNMGSDMTKLHHKDNLERIQEAWERLDKDILDYVINILRSQAYVDHTKEINSVYALVPIIVYVYNKGKSHLSQEEIKKIVKWFYFSQIRQRYVSQLPQKLDKDISIVVRSSNPFDELLNIIKAERSLEIVPDEFVGVDIRNALYSLMRWYFKSKNAVCFTTGVGIRRNMGEKYTLEWDHIFSYSVLKQYGYSMKNRLNYALAQEITNRAILTQVANRRKSDKLAVNYLKNIKQSFPDALKKQSIPEDETLWEIENFEKFLQKRREMLAKELNTFLENITETVELESEILIDELIGKGESAELEFKSSLRWSYKEEKLDRELEKVIYKTIAAFSNGEGGTLLIGVDDDGNVLGLNRDYVSLNGDRDEFELHLRNILNKTFGKVFVTSNLVIQFPILNSHEICRIDICGGEKPVYLETMNKDGQKIEKFYVRSGNSSQELKLSESSDYILTRFN